MGNPVITNVANLVEYLSGQNVRTSVIAFLIEYDPNPVQYRRITNLALSVEYLPTDLIKRYRISTEGLNVEYHTIPTPIEVIGNISLQTEYYPVPPAADKIGNFGLELETYDTSCLRMTSTIGLEVEYGQPNLRRISTEGLEIEYYKAKVPGLHKYGPRIQVV
jgi:hypothetical protein